MNSTRPSGRGFSIFRRDPGTIRRFVVLLTVLGVGRSSESRGINPRSAFEPTRPSSEANQPSDISSRRRRRAQSVRAEITPTRPLRTPATIAPFVTIRRRSTRPHPFVFVHPLIKLRRSPSIDPVPRRAPHRRTRHRKSELKKHGIREGMPVNYLVITLEIPNRRPSSRFGASPAGAGAAIPTRLPSYYDDTN